MKGGSLVQQKSKLVTIICVSSVSVILAAVLVFLLVFFLTGSRSTSPSISKLYNSWQNAEYQKVYDDSAVLMQKNPLNYNAVIFHGYASFYLALEQSDVTNTQVLLDEAIKNLRFAMYYADRKTMGQVYYMLGKAYFQKNNISNYHFYSDLVVKYLGKAVSMGYESPDIPEYLGLCYSDLGMNTESIIEFTRALKSRKSDTLLYAIALQYYKNGQNDIAKPYLVQIKQETEDSEMLMKSSLLLADISFAEGDTSSAKKEYEKIIASNPNCADAYYGLGNVYEKYGDLAKARSNWRKALKLQVNHAGAIKKLGI